MPRWKLNLDRETLDEIGKKHNVKIIKELDMYSNQDYSIGDFVITKWHTAGFIKGDYDLNRDIRVHIGDHIEMSCTGSHGRDTLEINGFRRFEVEKLNEQ